MSTSGAMPRTDVSVLMKIGRTRERTRTRPQNATQDPASAGEP